MYNTLQSCETFIKEYANLTLFFIISGEVVKFFSFNRENIFDLLFSTNQTINQKHCIQLNE